MIRKRACSSSDNLRTSHRTASACWAALLFVAVGCADAPVQAVGAPPPPRSGSLWIAGSGGALALARELASAFEAAEPGTRVVVHPSIGSSGAVRALGDHAIDVGLLTRAPRSSERAALGRVEAIAETDIALAAHPSVPVDHVGRSDLVSLFSGGARWSDGVRAIPVLREAGDSSQEALRHAVPGLGATLDRMWRQERYRIAWHDAELVETVTRVPGSFGVSDVGQNACEPRGARLVHVQGVVLRKHIYLALAPRPRSEARAFVEFAMSPRGRAVTRACGYRSPERR